MLSQDGQRATARRCFVSRPTTSLMVPWRVGVDSSTNPLSTYGAINAGEQPSSLHGRRNQLAWLCFGHRRRTASARCPLRRHPRQTSRNQGLSNAGCAAEEFAACAGSASGRVRNRTAELGAIPAARTRRARLKLILESGCRHTLQCLLIPTSREIIKPKIGTALNKNHCLSALEIPLSTREKN